MKQQLVSVALALLASVQLVQATTFTFNTSDSQFDPGVDNQGFWSATQPSINTSDNYFTGFLGQSEINSFFTFDLAALSGQQITSATLELRRYTFDSFGGDLSETVQFFDVSTPAATLNNNVGTSEAIFNDLGTGTNYGAFEISIFGSSEDVLSISLNSAALADIALAAGGFFSIGGRCITCNPCDACAEAVFSASSGNESIQRLVIETRSVPEPAALVLIGTGILALMVRRSRIYM